MTTPPIETCAALTDLPDSSLLRRFVQDADEEAFAEIVRRYQGLVNSVCQRVIGPTDDVSDAFQATFLALAQRPRTIRKCESLSSWLYSVAWRTSVRFVRQRRKQLLPPVPDQHPGSAPDPLQQITADRDNLILDEELNTLPGQYRDVLVMTYFARQTSQQIADQLRVSKGTVDGRIRQARNLLRVRLARRGVSLGVLAVVTASTSQATVAGISDTLLNSTVELGTQTLNGTLPGTTDLTHLDPLIRPEMTMLSAKALLTAAIAVLSVAGLASLSGAATDGKFPEGPAAGPAINATDLPVPAQTGSQPLATVLTTVLPSQPTVADLVDETTPAGEASVSNVRSENTITSLTDVQPVFTEYPPDAPASEIRIFTQLDEPVGGGGDFPGETPLSEVLQQLLSDREIPIWTDHVGLNDVGHSSLDEVLLTDVSIPDGMSTRNALELIFGQVPELTYLIQNEVLQITSTDTANDTMTTRVYRVGTLVDLPVRSSATNDSYPLEGGLGGMGGMVGGGGGMMGGMVSGGAAQDVTPPPNYVLAPAEDLTTLVVALTADELEWYEHGGEGEIRIVGNSLVVRQTQAGHREIVSLLNQLAAVRE